MSLGIEDNRDFSRKDGSRTFAYAPTQESHKEINRVLDEAFPGRHAGGAHGDFVGREVVSITRLVLVGVGLAERHRVISKDPDDPRARAIERSLQELLIFLSNNPEDFMGENPREIINKLLQGDISLQIKKINYEEIRHYMEAERAVLESL